MSTKKDETRLRLFDAARGLFLTRGFHGVSLEDIAEAAGVSRQAVYKSHFSSKADLVLELARHTHVAEKLDELIQPTREATSGLAMLEASIAAIVRIQVKLHDLAVMLSTAARTDAGAAAAWRERMEGQRGGLRAALTRVAAEGRLNPGWELEQAVDVLAVLLSTDSHHQLVVERGWKPETVIEKVWQLCQATMLVEPQAADSQQIRPKPQAKSTSGKAT